MTLPVLSCVLLVAGTDGIKLRATNLETGIDLRLAGSIEAEGVVALPANTFREIAASFGGEGTVTLTHKGETVVISSSSARSTIKTVPYEDFPTLPIPDATQSKCTLSGVIFKSLVSSVAGCASISTVRPELASILVTAEGGVLKAVATDSFRLAEKQIAIKGAIQPFSMLIPAKNAEALIGALPDGDIDLIVDEHQCALVWKEGTLTTRLVSAQYPDYTQIIPKTTVSEATLLKKDFEGALRRVSIFSDAFQKVKLSFDIKEKQITLASQNNDIGESSEHIPGSLSGDAVEMSFNHRYLGAPLPLISADRITFSASGIGRPLIIKGTGDTSFLYLVMPMNQ